MKRKLCSNCGNIANYPCEGCTDQDKWKPGMMTQRLKVDFVKRINELGTSGDSFHEVLDMVLAVYDQYKDQPVLERATVGTDGRVRLTHLKGETIEYRVVPNERSNY